jgi:hypothetical protein
LNTYGLIILLVGGLESGHVGIVHGIGKVSIAVQMMSAV